MEYFIKFKYNEQVFKYKIRGKLNMYKLPLYTVFIIRGIGYMMMMHVVIENECVLNCELTSVDGSFRQKYGGDIPQRRLAHGK